MEELVRFNWLFRDRADALVGRVDRLSDTLLLAKSETLPRASEIFVRSSMTQVAPTMSSPTVPPPRPTNLSATLTRNITALEDRRKTEAEARSWGERFADLVTGFAGSMLFVWIHAAVYGAWVVVNLGWVSGIPVFDKSFVILATEASVEGIFLSTFVLISQNKMTAAADKRANLDLQVNLLAEHEVTKLATMLAAVMEHLGIPAYEDQEVNEIIRDVAPEAVLDALEQQNAGHQG